MASGAARPGDHRPMPFRAPAGRAATADSVIEVRIHWYLVYYIKTNKNK